MKVKELIERLLKVDPEMIVYCTSNTGEYKYGLVNSASENEIDIYNDSESYDEENLSTVFVIDEE